MAAILTACTTASFKASAPAESAFVTRGLTETDEGITVTASVPTAEEFEALTGLVRDIPGNADLTDEEAFAHLYHVLGAISYFRISEPTLQGMFGKRRYSRVKAAFRTQISALIHAANNAHAP